MTKYFITLSPIDPYFFGGQITFGEGKGRNYLVRSEKFPTQTTIIGMLRKQVLIELKLFKPLNDYSPGERKMMDEKIGPKPFAINGDNDFGIIKKISPVFITDGELNYIPVPLDHKFKFNIKNGISGSNAVKEDKSLIPELTGYEAKKYLPSGYIANDGTTMKRDDEIFQPVEKIGITKGEQGVTKEEAYYKQTCYTFKDSFQFAVIVESDLKLSDSVVEIGGDRSFFSMKVKSITEDFLELFSNIPCKSGSVILLGDTVAPETIYDECDYAVTDTVSFRHFSNYANSRDKSDSYNLLKRGSVFYGNIEKISQALENQNLLKVGFNVLLKKI